MRRVTYQDRITTIIDVIEEDETGRRILQARRTTNRNEFGSIESEHHRVFQGNGIEDPTEEGVKNGQYE